MAKEPIKYKYKNRRKPEYTKEGMAQLEAFRKENQGKDAQEVDRTILGRPKRGHGRGKARDAGPGRRKAA